MRPIIARVFASAIAMAWMASGPALAAEKTDPLAPTGRWSANQDGQAALPPMGWNSWNAFNSDVDEEKVMASAQLIVDKGLREAGYRYINIDDGWWLRRRQPDGGWSSVPTNFPLPPPGPNQQTSFRPLTDRLHAMGFKAGIYSDIGRNSCGQVYTPISPISPKARSPSARSGCTVISIRISRSISANGASIISRSMAAAFAGWARTATMSARAIIAS